MIIFVWTFSVVISISKCKHGSGFLALAPTLPSPAPTSPVQLFLRGTAILHTASGRST